MLKKIFINKYQKKINSCEPKVNIALGMELPLPSAKEISELSSKISYITSLEEGLKNKPDSYFPQRTEEFKTFVKERLEGVKKEDEKKVIQETLDEILLEAFAMVREASVRALGMRHYDVQVLGGMVLNSCGAAEMATGEGKTLVSTLPAYLNALVGRGVHVITVNDYLASRDCEWMGKVHNFLGLSVGVIVQGQTSAVRRENYACDITYGTNNEFGFDYLRDNMVMHKEEMVQRGHFFAIVDEVDSILVDEARTPLIISGAVDDFTDKYSAANRVVQKLKGRRILEKDEIDAKHQGLDLEEDQDYLADEKSNTINVTEQGMAKCEQLLGVKDVYNDVTSQWPHFITQALRAHEFFKKDHHYIVKEGKVIIVDEFTGRLMPGRRWSDGLHQAVEAKEGIRIQEESQTLATVTLQNYFKMYTKLAGMTGTAYTEAGELKHIYNLDVVVIPTNRVLQRISHPDKIYKNEQAKFNAVVKEIQEENAKGRPILVGTASIEKSEILSSMLKRQGIEHLVLNAKYHEREANIVAQAGRKGRITIATNMAGRGTDIILGGNPEFLAKADLRQSGVDSHDDDYDEKLKVLLEKYKVELDKEQKEVLEAGGLHVIGTERHEARRIDNQLRGRCGRQGDPGSSIFYISLADDLMRLFGSDRIMLMMDKFGFEEDMPIEHPIINRSLETAQKRVEGQNFEIRKQLLDFDNVMNKQRTVVYDKRREAIEGAELKDDILDMIDEVLEVYIAPLFEEAYEDHDLEKEKLATLLNNKFGLDKSIKEKFDDKTMEELKEELFSLIRERYEEKETKVGSEQMRFMERMVYMQVIDSRWKEHLLNLDSLKEGIHLRSYAQRNPIDEYRHESYQAFMDMWHSVIESITDFIFKIDIKHEIAVEGVFSKAKQQDVHKSYSALSRGKEEKQQSVKSVSVSQKVGRNEPCPCGSGKKYKKCCG